MLYGFHPVMTAWVRCWNLQKTRRKSIVFVRPGLTCHLGPLWVFYKLDRSQSTALLEGRAL